MSYSTIYFIGLTVVFAIYYLALMYLDLKAKKEEKSDVETIDVPEPAPDAPPTEVEETDDGYVIKNGKNGMTVQMLLLAVRIRGMPLMATRLIMS